MATPRSKKRIEARQLFEAGGISVKKLAENLGLDRSMVQRWKAQDGWGVAGDTVANVKAVANDAVALVRPKKGRAAYQLAKLPGGEPPAGRLIPKIKKSGPPGNKHALKTGAFESIWMETLTPQEQADLENLEVENNLAMVREELYLISIREKRMMQRIKDTIDGLDDIERKTLQERCIVGHELIKIMNAETGKASMSTVPQYDMITTEIKEKSIRKIDTVLRIETALTQVQDRKAKLVQLKADLEEKAKEAGAGSLAGEHAKRLEELWKNR